MFLGKWVPKEITPEHQKLRIDHSLYMIKRVEADPFLDRVIFEGEKYLTYNKYKKHFKTKDAKNVTTFIYMFAQDFNMLVIPTSRCSGQQRS